MGYHVPKVICREKWCFSCTFCFYEYFLYSFARTAVTKYDKQST